MKDHKTESSKKAIEKSFPSTLTLLLTLLVFTKDRLRIVNEGPVWSFIKIFQKVRY